MAVVYHHFPETDSTNRVARSFFEEGASAVHVVTAGVQTEGRGQRGKVWVSDRGGLYYSIMVPFKTRMRLVLEESQKNNFVGPTVTMDEMNRIPTWAAGCVKRCLFALSNVRADIKYPNDLMVQNKKCAGILSESVIRGSFVKGIVLGVGVNLNQGVFSDHLADYATSLFLLTKRRYNKTSMARNLTREFIHGLQSNSWRNHHST